MGVSMFSHHFQVPKPQIPDLLCRWCNGRHRRRHRGRHRRHRGCHGGGWGHDGHHGLLLNDREVWRFVLPLKNKIKQVVWVNNAINHPFYTTYLWWWLRDGLSCFNHSSVNLGLMYSCVYHITHLTHFNGKYVGAGQTFWCTTKTWLDRPPSGYSPTMGLWTEQAGGSWILQ